VRILKFAALGALVLLCLDAFANDGAGRRALGRSLSALVAQVTGSNWHGLG
jgi:hypothetical protein